MTGRRVPQEVIADAITASGVTVADVEKAASLRCGELETHLAGGDITVRSLVAAGGFLRLSPADLFAEVA